MLVAVNWCVVCTLLFLVLQILLVFQRKPLVTRQLVTEKTLVRLLVSRDTQMADEDSCDLPSKRAKISEQHKDYKKQFLLSCKWRTLVDAKLHGAAPYNFFLTRIEDSIKTHDEDLTITFPELLDESLGTLEHSLHINYMVELPWLLAQYAVQDLINPAMTVLYGVEDDDLVNVPSHLNVTAVKIQPKFSFGHHHTKMSIFFYTDKSVRFAIYTANLIESDWENRTQGLWISPKCPYLGDDVPINYGESETFFKVDIIRYLNFYRLPELKDWLFRIQKADCSSIKVCFVASVPGDHTGNFFGHKKLKEILRQNSTDREISSWELVAQCSSIGSLGITPDSWLLGEFAQSLNGQPVPNPSINVIYPSVNNVLQSHDGMYGGACLPYSSKTHNRQLWLHSHLKQWKSDHRHRSRAVPHIKSYSKISPEGNKIAWFLLTSANLSKAAWGRLIKGETLKILSYEVGVLFLPKFLNGKNFFDVRKGGDTKPNEKSFPVPYDTPLTPYRTNDKIFLYDKCFS